MKRTRAGISATLAVLALMLTASAGGTQQSSPFPPSVKSQDSGPRLPSADDAMPVSAAKPSDKQLASFNAARQKEIVADTEKLLALAQQLKSDVDKSSKDTLSIDVIKKADEIERLAHTVKEKMRN